MGLNNTTSDAAEVELNNSSQCMGRRDPPDMEIQELLLKLRNHPLHLPQSLVAGICS